MTAPQPRIVITHAGGRLYTAQPAGSGHGPAWGTALAALDHHAHAATHSWPVRYYLDLTQLLDVLGELRALGINIDNHTKAAA